MTTFYLVEEDVRLFHSCIFLEDALMEPNRNFLLKHRLFVGGSKGNGTRPSSPPPPGVEVAEVKQQDAPIYSEWIGTLDGMVNAEIRAQAQGYLRAQRYTEGSFVRKGQLLF